MFETIRAHSGVVSRGWRSRAAASIFMGLAILMSSACGGDPPVVPTHVAHPLWALHANPDGAVSRVVGDSVVLHVTALDANRDTVAVDASRLKYFSSDTATVTVSPTGVIHAKRETAAGAPVLVSISYTADNVTVTDTTAMFVTPASFVPDSISLAAPDSGMYDLTTFPFAIFTPVVWGTDGQPHPEVGVTLYTAEDPGIYLLASYNVISYATLSALGPHWVYAKANVYGHLLTDSLVMVGTYASAQTVTMTNAVVGSGLLADPAVDGAQLYIVPCGTVTWTNNSTATLDVTFDVPAHTGGCTPGDTTGNITNLAPGNSATRAFAGLQTTTWTVARTSAPSTILLSGTVVNKSLNP